MALRSSTAHFFRRGLLGLALAALLAGGCRGGSEAEAGPVAQVTVIDRRTQGQEGVGLASLNGTYGESCSERWGGWSLPLDGSQRELDFPPLSTSEGDVGCVLTITGIRTLDGGLLAPQGSAQLGSDYPGESIAFGDPPQFYVNAKIEAAGALSAVGLTLVVSDSPISMAEAPSLQTLSASAQGGSVPSPDYDLDIASLVLQTDVQDVVQTLQGDAALRFHTVRALGYAIAPGRLVGYDALDAAYLRHGAEFRPVIPGAAFLLIGMDLTNPQIRTLILANVANGVRSYQAFTITFSRDNTTTL